MKKIISSIVFVGAFILFVGGSPKQLDEFFVMGSISNEHDGEMVMLFKLLGDSVVSVDTTIVKNGAFIFQ